MAKKVVRAIILNKEGKVLLGKRTGSDASGKWALVGGKPDKGETIKDTIIREVKEELGLLFKPYFWMDEMDKISITGEVWTVSYFYGQAEGKLNLKKDEVEATTFVGREDLENLEVAYDHKKILNNFFKSVLK